MNDNTFMNSAARLIIFLTEERLIHRKGDLARKKEQLSNYDTIIHNATFDSRMFSSEREFELYRIKRNEFADHILRLENVIEHLEKDLHTIKSLHPASLSSIVATGDVA